jgi:porphobilinogen deaminase
LEVERTVLTRLGGGCREPIGALAQADGDDLRLHVFAATEDGSHHTRVTSTVSDLNSDEIARIVERVQGDIAT